MEFQGFDKFIDEAFDYDALKIFENKIVYKLIEAKNIVFCEGYALNRNPW